MKKYASSFYKSVAWQNMQGYIMRRDKYLCQECLKRGHIKPAALVHHIKPITPDNINDPEITLNEKNLEAVCTDCHSRIHAYDKAQGRAKAKRNGNRRYSVEPDGTIAPRG